VFRQGVCLEYAFDRLFNAKLQQVYEICVPDRVRITGAADQPTRDHHEECRDLRVNANLKLTPGGQCYCGANIYARVSSVQQKEEHTIASQTAALILFAQKHDYHVPREWVSEDEGFSGASLERPGLERVRCLAAEGQLQAVVTRRHGNT
jgi:hypothetical protein